MKLSKIKISFRRALIFVLILIMIIPVKAATVTYDGGSLTAKFPEKADESVDIDITEDSEEEDWTDWIEDDAPILSNIEISNEFTPTKVAENKNYIFWYDTTGADVYLYDKRSGVIWSNMVDDSYYSREDADVAMLTQLFSISIADENGEITVCDLCDAVGNANQFMLEPTYEDSKLILNVKMLNFDITFDMVFGIDSSGLTLSIPTKAINQGGTNRIVSIAAMPYFGAAKTDEEGYIFIPDGSGALVEFKGAGQKEERVYSYQLYGMATQEMDTLIKRDEQDIKNMMLPVFGIRRKNSGFLTAVSKGAENAVLNVVPNGYQCKELARAYFTFNYVYTEKLTINGKAFEEVMSIQELSDREIKYFILESSACDYSDMAARYRKYLEESGVLINEIELSEPIVSLDVLMGVNKSGLFSDKYVKMTTIDDLKEIVNDLCKAGVKAELTLQGWNTGGFTNIPTPSKISGGLGSKSDLIKFTEWAKEKGVEVYLYNNFIEGNTASETINLKKDVVRDYIGNIVSDERQTNVMLNIHDTLLKQIKTARSTGIYKNSAFSLARAGQWLWNNYDKDNSCTRAQTVEACTTALEDTLRQEGSVQIYGGNQYVLPYADSLREIPDTSSGYYYATKSVPFYQMVVSGYANYSSVAGNLSYDLNYQKLKWIEYGSSPYYVITKENAINLVDSDYDKLFSSEYSVWGETIKSIYKEYSDNLTAINNSNMISHRYISDTLVCVGYDNGTQIYINYDSNTANSGGISIPAMSYKVVTSGKEATK